MATTTSAWKADEQDHTIDPLVVPGVIGAELARHTAAIEEVLQAFKRTRAITRSQMQTLAASNAAVQRVARYSQQISRLAAGRLRQSHERVNLDELLAGVIRENDWRYEEAGVTVDQHLRPVAVILDPALLVSLLETAVDCAGRYGQVVQCFLSIKDWPQHGLLTLKARHHVAPSESQENAEDTLEWIMLLHLAQSIGVIVGRERIGHNTIITVEFPRTVRQLEGLTAVEVDSGEDSSILTQSKPLAGHRVLLITGDERLRSEMQTICEAMRLVLDVCPTSRHATRFCELDRPDMIVVDEKAHDAPFDELRDDLLRYDLNFPCIEIAAGANVVEVSMGDRMSRVSRDALQSQLPSVLAMEMAKVF